MTKRIFIIAGEASGDILGAGLVRELKKLLPGAIFSGVGGEEMKATGVKSIFPLSDIAVMGLTEVLSHLPLIRRRIEETAAAAKAFKPDIIITIDAPAFTRRVAKRVKGLAPLVHYVAPSVWAYRPKRARRLAETYDALLCFFDFEKPYFERYGLATTVVGHAASAAVPARKARESGKNLVLLPGSRPAMAKRLLPVYREVLSQMKGYTAAIPIVETNEAIVRAAVKDWKTPIKIITSRSARYKAFADAAGAISISGTGVLELALMGVPTVAVYKTSFITYMLARLMLNIKSITLPNIILGREMVKEFIQHDATPEKIRLALLKLLSDKSEYARDAVELRRSLSKHRNPSFAAAKAVAELLPRC